MNTNPDFQVRVPGFNSNHDRESNLVDPQIEIQSLQKGLKRLNL